MYQRALQGYEKALGRDHKSTLRTVDNLGRLYYDQGRLEGLVAKTYASFVRLQDFWVLCTRPLNTTDICWETRNVGPSP